MADIVCSTTLLATWFYSIE